MTSTQPDAKLFQEVWGLPGNPFPFLGADNYEETEILSLFEIDNEKAIKAFALQNSIIEGTYGTGKTMLLKAVHSFYYSKMIVDIAESKRTDVIPVYVQLSDIPNNADDMYKEMILTIYREMLNARVRVTDYLGDSRFFDNFKLWLSRLAKTGVFAMDKRYEELSADAATKQIKRIFTTEGSAGLKWIKNLSLQYESVYQKELLSKPRPGITDIESLFVSCFSAVCEKVLLLIDEVDSLPSAAFNKTGSRLSPYEAIFNQLRTNGKIVYKVAVYPETESSNQLEGSRIGARIKLGFNVRDPEDFAKARDFYYRIMRSYLSHCSGKQVEPESYFHIDSVPHYKYANRKKHVDGKTVGDSLEQLVFGSNGITRRMIKFSGDSMISRALTAKKGKVSKYDIYDAMRSFGKELVERLKENERLLIDQIAHYCMKNGAFRFRVVGGNESVIQRLHDRGKQDNIVYSLLDQRRSGVIYLFEFDYCYCIYRNVPTHVYLNAEMPNAQRSVVNGKWIVRPVDVPQAVVDMQAKISGEVVKYSDSTGYGFVSYLPGDDLYFHKVNVISVGSGGMIARGLPVLYRLGKNYEGPCAIDVEVL